MAITPLPSTELLRQLFSYNEKDGTLTWRRGQKSGSIAGTRNSEGYTVVFIDRKQYRAHRIAWKLHYGTDPRQDIDHIDGVRSNNRIDNLRAVSRAENMKNSRLRSDNSSGVIGVSWVKSRSKWNAHISFDGRQKNLGNFSTKEEAIAARGAAQSVLGFHRNHGKRRIDSP